MLTQVLYVGACTFLNKGQTNNLLMKHGTVFLFVKLNYLCQYFKFEYKMTVSPHDVIKKSVKA